MTALEQFIRLEAPGRWRAPGGDEWREVLVSFGNATLVLSSFDEEPLTHWSLAAAQRIEGGGDRSLYAPDMDSDEALEITDSLMNEAIERVTAQVRGAQMPVPARRRLVRPWMILLAVAGLTVAAAVTYVPDLLRGRALALVPQARAALLDEQIGAALAPELCRGSRGIAALSRLLVTVAPGARAVVVQRDVPPVARLPGGTLVLSRPVVESADSAEALAGWVALAGATPRTDTALALWIGNMPVREVVSFLASARIRQSDVLRMARDLAHTPFAPKDAQVMQALEQLNGLGIPTAPFLEELSGYRPVGAFVPSSSQQSSLLADQAWVALQGMCTG